MLSREEFRAFLNLLMVNYPNVNLEGEYKLLIDAANRIAKEKGFDSWINAHRKLNRMEVAY